MQALGQRDDQMSGAPATARIHHTLAQGSSAPSPIGRYIG